jgi:uncharacterized protein (DUF305 family)
MSRIRTIPAAVAVTAALALAACGDSADTTQHGDHTAGTAASAASAASAAHNAADVMFAQMMIPHHQQALEMAVLARTRAGNSQVKALAAKIEAAQQPEIQTMKGWLKAWGAPLQDPSGGMGHGSMGHGSMPGMMTDADMAKLKAATGTAFDRMFLELMIAHHTGAIEMAETELAQGQNPDAKALAEEIRAAQTAEITAMRALLKTLR